MAQRKKHVFLTNAVSAGVSSRCLSDYRFGPSDSPGVVYGTITSGAHINIYHNVYDDLGNLLIHHLDAVISAGASTYLTTATNSFNYPIPHVVEEIEVVNVLTCGTANAVGLI